MARPILLLNCGSSSIKYQMIDSDTEAVSAVGLVQKIGDTATGTLDHELPAADGGEAQEFHLDQHFADHTEAIAAVIAMFHEHGPNLDAAIAVGHRTVHGGEAFRQTTVIDDAVVAKMVELSGLAPLHNPPAIAGIRAAMAQLPDVPHVAIFDTAFFSDLPPEAYTYAIDTELASQHRIRKYGFHGTSHQYVAGKAAEFLGKDISAIKQIVCHLGNGASISAIDGGHPIDTSMGFTPLQGLVMGTRSGDIDPGLHAYLCRKLGMSIDDVDNVLNKKSGMLGLTGFTDMRDVSAAIAAGDERARLGLDVYVHRLVSYIGSYVALLGGVDAITFTAGVGENHSQLRQMVVSRLGFLGITLDADENLQRRKEPRAISTPESKVAVLVIPTNEELAMARETLKAIRWLAKFEDSYVGRLRAHVGNQELLVPASQILVLDGAGNMLVQRRTDDGLWEIPGGTADHQNSFRTTAVKELFEEAGISVTPDQLLPFASVSNPEAHTVTYPNGDVTHAYSLVFAVTVPHDALSQAATDGEATEHHWVPLGRLPQPSTRASQRAVEMYTDFVSTGQFQAD